MTTSNGTLFLGIDTGGTYTDAVLFNPDRGILAKAKSLTTKHDLSIGISGAVDSVMQSVPGCAPDIALVSISTTLATNALVEGKGGSVGLVMIGFEPQDAEKSGLRDALGGDPVIFLAGGHNVSGNERPLSLEGMDEFVSENHDGISGFAVAGMFAVRNPSHELKLREYLQEKTGLPVTCSHELSSKLGGPKRALTTVLNARLVPVIQRLIVACQGHLESTGISAPLMVVRGDGTLVDASFALDRPIETILSGPAASLVGAKHLLGKRDAVVSDIGGTTTDIAILEGGWPRIEPEGARVGGFTTMVEAVAMHTFGLGGDSAVSIEDQNPSGIKLGPRRQIPVSLLATQYPSLVTDALNAQLSMDAPSQNVGRFAMRSSEISDRPGNLKATEQKLYDRLSVEPVALEGFIKGASELGTLNKLVSRGLTQLSGFTPSDAMHVLGLQDNWNVNAAQLIAQVFARMKDRFGQPLANSVEALAQRVKDQLTTQSCDVIVQTTLAEDGISVGPGATELMARALERKPGFLRFSLKLDRPLIGLGASASTYYPAIGERLATECMIPEDADVANAVGAVTSEVRVTSSIIISSNDGGGSLTALMPEGPKMFADEEAALTAAYKRLEAHIFEMAEKAGASEPEVETKTEIHAPEIEGSRHFVEAIITATATGKPRVMVSD